MTGEARGHRRGTLQVWARHEDESIRVNGGRAARSPVIPSSRVHDEGSVQGPAGGGDARVIGAGTAARVPDEGPHSAQDGQVIAQRWQIAVLPRVEVRPPHAGDIALGGASKPGHRPGGVNDDHASRPPAFTTPRPAPPAFAQTAPTPELPGQQTHDARRAHPAADPGDHPHRAGHRPPVAGLGDEGDEERRVPGQTHLPLSPNAHAGHADGHGRAWRGEDQQRAGRVRAHPRPGEFHRVTGALQVGRGEADEGDRTPIRGIVRLIMHVHAATLRLRDPSRPPARVPLWTTQTRNATLCIEGARRRTLWIEPTLE